MRPLALWGTNIRAGKANRMHAIDDVLPDRSVDVDMTCFSSNDFMTDVLGQSACDQQREVISNGTGLGDEHIETLEITVISDCKSLCTGSLLMRSALPHTIPKALRK